MRVDFYKEEYSMAYRDAYEDVFKFRRVHEPVHKKEQPTSLYLLPYEKRRTHGDEVDMDDVVVVGPPVQIVNDVFEDAAQMADPEEPSQAVQDPEDKGEDVEEVDTSPAEPAPFEVLQHVVTA